MYCPKCGKQIPDGSKFCPECGAQIETPMDGGPTNNGGTTTITNTNAPYQASALAAGLLGIFLGTYGVHNFYLHYTGKAIAQLILGLLVVTAPVSAIWGFVEGIMCLTGSINVDGNGKPIKHDI